MLNKRVLLVDDDPAVLKALSRAFTLEGFDVRTATDGEAGLRQAEEQAPDLIVLDVMLPDIDGFTACEQIRCFSATPILMLTARDTVPDRVRGLDRGADDYLVKPFSLDELLARSRALLRRTHPQTGNVLEYEDVSLDLLTRQVFRGGRMLQLTPHEFELLAFFLQHQRLALTREQLSEHVWGFSYSGESNFVDAAVKDLRRKLEADGGVRLIETLRGHGYAFRRMDL